MGYEMLMADNKAVMPMYALYQRIEKRIHAAFAETGH